MLEQDLDSSPTLVQEPRGDRQASASELVLAAFRASGVRAGVAEILDDDLRLLVANPALGRQFGVEPAMLEGRTLRELPLSRTLAVAWSGMARESWNVGEATRFRHVDRGTDPPRHLVFQLTPLSLDHRRLCSFSVDEVTPTQIADDRAEVHFRHIADAAPALLWTSDIEGERSYFNRRWMELTGATADELLGWSWLERVHGDDRERCREVVESAFHDRDAFRHEYRLLDAGGCWRWVVEHGAPRRRSDGSFLGFVGSCFDITARHRVEERLRENERWYSELIEGTDNLVLQVDADDRITFVNPVSRDVFGAEPEECVGFPWLDFVYPHDRDSTGERLERWRRGGAAGTFEHRVLSRRGEVRDILWTVSPHRKDGRHLSLSCIGQDITERKRSERVHKIQSQVLESMTEGVTLSNAAGFILYTNPALDSMFGFEPGELIGQSFTVLATGEHDLRALLRSVDSWQGEIPQRRKDGGEILATVHAISIEIDGSAHRVTVFDDVTARRRAEDESRRLDQRLLEAQKLESLAVLAGGVAHDFNNLLMVILGNASLALQDLAGGTPRREDLQTIESAALRAAELTRQMLAYSGKGCFVVEPLDLSDLVREIKGLVLSSLPDDARLELRLAGDLPAVDVDRAQLSQALMNLVRNAAEALPEGRGEIVLSTDVRSVDRTLLERAAPTESLPAGDYVALTVRDDGVGMDDSVKTRVFDPFFTTKFTGRGLGLAAVLGIVRGHQGAILIESAPGQGASFTLMLPPAEIEQQAEPEPPPPPTQGSARETVLLVDDDTEVRTMARRMLERMGFDVLEARDGRHAVEVYGAHADTVDAVLLDLAMPEMDGVATFHALRAVRSDVRVVLTSGYGEDTTTERFGAAAPDAFLQKPFRQTELLLALDKVLDLRS
ncbi:MAG: PAS domain S-box protein [Acidobacteriota bacterium]